MTSSGSKLWMSPQELARVTGGVVEHDGPVAEAVSTDTRSLARGDLFVALRGARFDANLFAARALELGAAGVLVDRPLAGRPAAANGFVVRVDDCKRALQQVASEHRSRISARVIGITGSCGKTTTKDLCRAALAASGPTVAARGSFNNQIGLPLTLLSVRPETRFAVCELGTSGPGEIERLAKIARPDIGVLTCVREAHLEKLGSLEGIAIEKASLFRHLSPGGLAVLDADDPFCVRIAAELEHEVRLVSTEGEADLFATDLRRVEGGMRFRVHGESWARSGIEEGFEVFLPRSAQHDVKNALFALEVGRLCGVPARDLVRGLATVEATPRRLELRQRGGLRILDDTWNMSPSAALAALTTLRELAGSTPRVVVFGDMRELGEQTRARHEELGEAVAADAPDLLVAVGEESRALAQSARSSGMPAERVVWTSTVQEAYRLLSERLRGDEVVLCKASRGIGLDRLVDQLIGGELAGGGAQPEAELGSDLVGEV